jgi:glyoxylase-like metal-dependent hydrolase (beta-lactamase superfamily II)
LIIHSEAKILMVDTAWNDEQTKLILDWIEKKLKSRPLMTLITHYHEDRLGGIGEVHRRGIKTFSSDFYALPRLESNAKRSCNGTLLWNMPANGLS